MSTPKLTRTLLLACATLITGACGSSNPYPGLLAPDLYRLAFEEYEAEEYDRAIRALDRLLAAYGDWDRVPDARMLRAHAFFAQDDFLAARSEYRRYIDRYPGHPDSPIAALGICRSLSELSPHPQRDQAFTLDAIASCRNVVIDYAGTPQSEEAAAIANSMRGKMAEKEFGTAEFYFRRKLYDSAIKYYEFVVGFYAETEYAPRALLGLYRANLAIDYEDLAEDARQRLLTEYPDSPAAAEVRTNGAGG